MLNTALKGKDYLVGNKCTYADLAFVPWASMAGFLLKDQEKVEQMERDYPDYGKWMGRLTGREGVKKVLEEKARVSGH